MRSALHVAGSALAALVAPWRARMRTARLAWLPLGLLAACGGTHAGTPPTTHVQRTALHDDGAVVARIETAARVAGCVQRHREESTTRLFVTCGEVSVLFASGPWAGVLSVQCIETDEDAACSALVRRLSNHARDASPR